MKDNKPLSASRIKTLQSCSWLYWCKYHLKTPNDDNDGSLRGTVCHTVFECLGKEKHYSKFEEIIKAKSIWECKPVARLVKIFCKKNNIDDEANLKLVNQMILEGLNYDFFAKVAAGRFKVTEAHDELDFDIVVDEEDKNYRILGFIDKLFVFKGKKLILIRDFKTSKSVFSEDEIEDNIQNLMYRLAAKHLYPKYNADMEFIFVKFPCGDDGVGIIKTPHVSDDELEGFEYYLTEVQEEINNFDEKAARSNFAYHQGFPDSSEGFCKKLLCGFAKKPGQLKKDGTPMWHCPVKFPFDYYQIIDENGDVVKGVHIDDKDEIKKAKEKGCKVKRVKYKGCPCHNTDPTDDVFTL